jgi:hypothetical protein
MARKATASSTRIKGDSSVSGVRRPDGTRWSVVPDLEVEGASEEQQATVEVTLLGTTRNGLYSLRTVPPMADEHFNAFKSACRAAHAEWSWGARAWRLPGQRGAQLVDAFRADGFAVALVEGTEESVQSLAAVVLARFGLESVFKASLDTVGDAFVVRVPDEYDLGVGYECPCDAVAALVLQSKGMTLTPGAAARLDRIRGAF